MIRHIGSVEVNTDAMQLFRNGEEIQCPYDIKRAYDIMLTFEYLRENYANTDDDIWNLAVETREIMDEAEGDNNPITESDAIKIACDRYLVELEEEDENVIVK